MIIGILTYHYACNFGANLQVLSTVSYWKNRGHEPVIIDWRTRELENVYLKNTPPEQWKEHQAFREHYFPLTRKCYSDEDIVSIIREEGIQAIVVGSDAVAQHYPLLTRIIFPSRKIITFLQYSPDRIYPNPFWASFLENNNLQIPVAMMSVSCQNSPYDRFPSSLKKRMARSLSRFSHVSVRDKWTAKMMSEISRGSVNPTVTPDPVFAFNHNFSDLPSKKEILDKFSLHEDYCLFSFHNAKTVSVNWLKEMQDRLDSKNVESVALPFPQGIEFPHPFKKEISLPLSPLDWYCLIKYAKAYIGDNMHPVIVCLHNGVPCFSFDHYGLRRKDGTTMDDSSKIYDILESFRLLGNRVSIIDKNYRQPSPEHVLDRLQAFNPEQVMFHSKEKLHQYLEMMQQIETGFSKIEV